MHKSTFIACFVLISLFFSACSPEPTEDPNVVILDIPTEFKIDLWEELDPGQRTFEFHVNTIQERYCDDSKITYNISKNQNNVQFSLNEIAPLDCPGEHEAYSTIPVNDLEHGVYNLGMNIKENIINQGLLIIDDLSYTIDMESTAGFELRHKQLMKIPQNTIWGYVGFENETMNEIATNVITDIEFISTENGFTEGYYGYFSIDENNQVKYDYEINTSYLPFIFDFEGEETELVSILDLYRQNFPNSMNIKLFNDKGLEL